MFNHVVPLNLIKSYCRVWVNRVFDECKVHQTLSHLSRFYYESLKFQRNSDLWLCFCDKKKKERESEKVRAENNMEQIFVALCSSMVATLRELKARFHPTPKRSWHVFMLHPLIQRKSFWSLSSQDIRTQQWAVSSSSTVPNTPQSQYIGNHSINIIIWHVSKKMERFPFDELF